MLISIIIPTRERARYLRHSLATALAIKDDRLEIVVSDNASTDDTRDVVESCGDARVRYFNTGRRVSMRMNFEFAFERAKGDYLICFGDDDGIVPGQFPILRSLLESRRPDGVSWTLPTYGWPVEGYGTKVGGVRFRSRKCFGMPERLEPEAAIRLLQAGNMDKFFRLPRIYHGAMSRDFMERLKDPDGVLFRARSPDIYASFRAVLLGGTFDHYPHPFSINGHSPSSTGGSMSGVGDRQKAGATDQRFLVEAQTDPVEDIIPVTLSMALAFLGTAQTAAAIEPVATFEPDYMTWYLAALRNMRRKQPDIAEAILNSLVAHAAQFGTGSILEAARSKRGIDWSVLRTRLQNGLEKLWTKDSVRLLARDGGENTIFTAAKMTDVFLGQDAAQILQGRMDRGAAWTSAMARSSAYERQI